MNLHIIANQGVAKKVPANITLERLEVGSGH